MKIHRYPSQAAEKRIAAIVNRGVAFKAKDIREVTKIIDDVRRNGDRALVQYTRRFDAPGLKPDALQVSDAEFAQAAKLADRGFNRALNRAVKQIEAFHALQRPRSWIHTERPGTWLGQMVNPVDVAGIYVPGGKGGNTPLVSSVLMGAIPAKIAGVGRVIMVTPPSPDGSVNPYLLAAARKVGIDAVYKVGSAWAVAALAHGSETIPRVDVIVGPGNIYVTLAKKIVAGTVGIDMVAGPSEILIIADRTADPEFIAADLLSQAEHDPLASAVLITDSIPTAEAVNAALSRQLPLLSRTEIAAESLSRFGALLVVPAIDDAIALANRIAPEHLELHTESPFDQVGRLRNAGAVFLGPYTPEPMGDYIAGPNHVLPTAGTARFASALSVDHFMKKTSILHYSEATFRNEARDVVKLAEIEGLTAHANAVKIRLR